MRNLTAIALTIAVAHALRKCPASGEQNLCVRGKALKNIEVDTPEQCCAACYSTAGCAAYQFSTDPGVFRNCALKPSAQNTGKGNCTSGILSPGPDPGPDCGRNSYFCFRTTFPFRPRARNFPTTSAYICVGRFPYNNGNGGHERHETHTENSLHILAKLFFS